MAEGYPPDQRDAVYRVIAERRDVRQGFRPDPVPAERTRPGARRGAPGALGGLLPAVGLHRDHRPGPPGADRGPGRPAPGRVRRGPARRPGPRVRPAEDRVDPRHAGQRRGQLRPHPRRPAHAGPGDPAADRGLLQRARGGEPVAGRPGRGPGRRLGELLRRARARHRTRAARARGGHRVPVRRLRGPVRARAGTGGGGLGATSAVVVGGARRGVRPPRNARGGTSGPARRHTRRDRAAGRRGDGGRAGAAGPDDQAARLARRARRRVGAAGRAGRASARRRCPSRPASPCSPPTTACTPRGSPRGRRR